MRDEQLQNVYYYLMERVMRRAREISKQTFAANDIPLTIDQWILLKRIAESTEISQTELSESTFKEPASVTRILDILQRKGFVERRPVSGDRRKYHVHLTSEGQQLYEKALPHVVDIREQGVEGMSGSELEQFRDLLRRMYENLSD